MLGEEKLIQQRVYLQQTFAVQPHIVAVRRQEPFVPKLAERTGESLLDVDAELALEVGALDMAALHLKNQLTDHALFGSGRQRTVNRKLAFLELVDIRREFM